jgi:DNA modification methylase
MDLRNGDCLELMKSIPDKSVDLLICDLPYGETSLKWDIKIDMEKFWKEFKRIRKSPRVACIHFCSTKFGYTLIKSWEKGFKMDMCLKKRNKTGGLQSRHRPMRNHEMVYFFYDQAPKYNRDKYHKRIKNTKEVEEEEKCVVEEEQEKCLYGFNKKDKQDYQVKDLGKNHNFEPPNPSSVLEENPLCYKMKKFKDGGHCGRLNKDGSYKMGYEPPNPASVLEEQDFCYGSGDHLKAKGNTQGTNNFDPPNPGSVFDSEKVFIGKRNHQTEKPQDILEFFLKYWTDEDDVVLDPTMGSGSTGVACKKLKRKFIGFELDPKIYEVADKRINKIDLKIEPKIIKRKQKKYEL